MLIFECQTLLQGTKKKKKNHQIAMLLVSQLIKNWHCGTVGWVSSHHKVLVEYIATARFERMLTFKPWFWEAPELEWLLSQLPRFSPPIWQPFGLPPHPPLGETVRTLWNPAYTTLIAIWAYSFIRQTFIHTFLKYVSLCNERFSVFQGCTYIFAYRAGKWDQILSGHKTHVEGR